MNQQLTQIYGYLHGMWRFRWSALLVAWLVVLVGWPVVLALPDQFGSRAVVYVDTSSALKPLLKGLAPEADTQDELRVMTRVLLSRDNLLSVMRETDMDLEVTSPQQREDMVIGLRNAINIVGGSSKRWEENNNMYEISYSNNSADRAYHVVLHLLNTMIENTLNSSRTDTVAAQKFLDKQIMEHEKRLSVAEQQLAEFKKSNVGFMPDERGGYYMRLQRAQDAVDSTQSQILLVNRQQSELKKQLSGENPLLSMGNYQSAAELKIKQHQERHDALLNQYTEQHPDVRAVKAIIEDLNAGLLEDPKKSTGQVSTARASDEAAEFNPVYQQMKVELSKASVELEILKIQLIEQTRSVAKLKSSIDIIPEVEAKLARLNRDYDVTRTRYLDLVERRESALLAQSAGKSTSDVTFRIIEPPIVPLKPTGPKRVLLLAGVLLAALASGLVLSYLRYMLNPTFFDTRQLASVSGLPVLGSVSLYLSHEHKKRRQIQLVSFLSATALLVVALAFVYIYREQGIVIIGSLL